MHPPRWLVATLPLVALASGQDCYFPNGSKASSMLACPVVAGNDAAACCFQNHYCMINGLCLSPTEGTWYRGACTDQNYQESGCPKFCDKSDIVGAIPGRHAAVWACASKIFACSSLGNCAKQNFTVGPYRALMNLALQTDLGGYAETPSATPIAGTSTGGSTGGASVETCPPASEASGGISTGAAAGIGVGVGLPLTLAVGALTFMLLREKKRARAALASQQYPGYAPAPPSSWGKPETGHYAPAAEVDGQSMPPELASSNQGRHELPH